MADESVPPGLDSDVLHRVVTIEVETEHLSGMRHEARVRHFSFVSDEPPEMAGSDEDPAPLDYFAGAVGL